jgi:hypothetical protein
MNAAHISTSGPAAQRRSARLYQLGLEATVD